MSVIYAERNTRGLIQVKQRDNHLYALLNGAHLVTRGLPGAQVDRVVEILKDSFFHFVGGELHIDPRLRGGGHGEDKKTQDIESKARALTALMLSDRKGSRLKCSKLIKCDKRLLGRHYSQPEKACLSECLRALITDEEQEIVAPSDPFKLTLFEFACTSQSICLLVIAEAGNKMPELTFDLMRRAVVYQGASGLFRLMDCDETFYEKKLGPGDSKSMFNKQARLQRKRVDSMLTRLLTRIDMIEQAGTEDDVVLKICELRTVIEKELELETLSRAKKSLPKRPFQALGTDIWGRTVGDIGKEPPFSNDKHEILATLSTANLALSLINSIAVDQGVQGLRDFQEHFEARTEETREYIKQSILLREELDEIPKKVINVLKEVEKASNTLEVKRLVQALNMELREG